MTIKAKRRLRMTVMILVLIVVAAIYIYPVFLMFMNSFKPFGEIVANVLALPKSLDLSNYTYVVKKMDYLALFKNNVIITVIGIVGIVIFSSMAAYILDRRKGTYSRIAYLTLTLWYLWLSGNPVPSFPGHHPYYIWKRNTVYNA